MEITIRDGAMHNDLTIREGDKTSTFDISQMNRAGRAKTRRMLVGALSQAGILNDQGGKFSMRAAKANSRRKPRRARKSGRK